MKEKSTLATLASIVLGFEVIVVFLAGLTIFGLKLVSPSYLGLIGAGLAIILIIIAISLLRRNSFGIMLGHILHVAYFMPSLLLPPIAIIATIFLGLWIFAIYKGNEIDRLRRVHIAQLQASESTENH